MSHCDCKLFNVGVFHSAVTVRVTTCLPKRLEVVYLMRFKGGRPEPLTSTLLAEQLVRLLDQAPKTIEAECMMI